jgi:hypothetical protein
MKVYTGYYVKVKKEKEVINSKIGNHQLKYNKNPKMLGFILDEQLNFNNHIEYIIKRAKRSLGIIREIKRIAISSLLKSTGKVLLTTSNASKLD